MAGTAIKWLNEGSDILLFPFCFRQVRTGAQQWTHSFGVVNDYVTNWLIDSTEVLFNRGNAWKTFHIVLEVCHHRLLVCRFQPFSAQLVDASVCTILPCNI